MNRKPIFDAVRSLLGRGFNDFEVAKIDRAIDAAIADPIELGPSKVLTVSKAGVDLIKEFEGCKLTAYKCSAGVPTIGWGATRINGKPVTMGLRITQEMADELLLGDIERHADPVRDMVKGYATQGQFDALVSFAFNLGVNALRRSTLLRKHMEGDHAGAADEFAKWTLAGGRRLKGLVRRRAAEAARGSARCSRRVRRGWRRRARACPPSLWTSPPTGRAGRRPRRRHPQGFAGQRRSTRGCSIVRSRRGWRTAR